MVLTRAVYSTLILNILSCQLCGRLFSNLTEYVNRTLYKLTALFLATEFVWYKVLLKLFQIL